MNVPGEYEDHLLILDYPLAEKAKEER